MTQKTTDIYQAPMLILIKKLYFIFLNNKTQRENTQKYFDTDSDCDAFRRKKMVKIPHGN